MIQATCMPYKQPIRIFHDISEKKPAGFITSGFSQTTRWTPTTVFNAGLINSIFGPQKKHTLNKKPKLRRFLDN